GGDQRLAFIAVHKSRGFEQRRFIFFGDHQKAVLVGVDQLSRLHGPPEDFHLAAPTRRPRISVPDAQPSGQRLEARVTHLVQVAYAAIHNRPDATQRAVYVRIDLAQERADEIRLIQILDDDDLRPPDTCHITAIFVPAIRVIFPMRGIARLANDRDCVADHRAHLRHEINGLFEIESVAPRVTVRHLLPAVVDRRRVPAAQFQQFAARQTAGTHLILRFVDSRNHYQSLLLRSEFKAVYGEEWLATWDTRERRDEDRGRSFRRTDKTRNTRKVTEYAEIPLYFAHFPPYSVTFRVFRVFP